MHNVPIPTLKSKNIENVYLNLYLYRFYNEWKTVFGHKCILLYIVIINSPKLPSPCKTERKSSLK